MKMKCFLSKWIRGYNFVPVGSLKHRLLKINNFSKQIFIPSSVNEYLLECDMFYKKIIIRMHIRFFNENFIKFCFHIFQVNS